MHAELEVDFRAVAEFMKAHLPGYAVAERQRAIGLRRDGELVAGVIFEGFNGRNLWMHVASKPGRRWLNREYLSACFRYAFVDCGVERVSGYVEASNLDARRFDEALGFKEEARLKGAAQDGGDVILYVMRREDCRYGKVSPNGLGLAPARRVPAEVRATRAADAARRGQGR
ncbi:GNAT family N-acetyltransferase [Roseateles chitosanitabidus]|uniref:GNAT family N-acetyltransferase n=1 Tax=Roseateles chitosanitabidus TaxID=65048 RepID=UPI00157DEE6C|nr:GNAT family protein [Roseateles chitosanitabidus]